MRVVDRGPGISARELERVFEAFNRGGGSDGHGGSGLGLAIARGFVEANGGRDLGRVAARPGDDVRDRAARWSRSRRGAAAERSSRGERGCSSATTSPRSCAR